MERRKMRTNVIVYTMTAGSGHIIRVLHLMSVLFSKESLENKSRLQFFLMEEYRHL